MSRAVHLSSTFAPHPETCLTRHAPPCSPSLALLSTCLPGHSSVSPGSSFLPRHFYFGSHLWHSQTPANFFMFLYAVLHDHESSFLIRFTCRLSFYSLPWRFPPGFTCCQTASAPWGLSSLGGPPPRPLLRAGSKMECWERPVESGICGPCRREGRGVSSPTRNFRGCLSGPCRPL